MRLETLAVSKLMERMVNNGASLEELKKVADYMVTAAVYDEMTVNLYDVAEKNGIKELVKKYPPRFSWLGSSDTSAKELLNLNHGVPKHEYDFFKTKVGDKITVDLKELGKFEATAHEVTDNNVLFIFDDYIAERLIYAVIVTYLQINRLEDRYYSTKNIRSDSLELRWNKYKMPNTI